jgi:Na+/H+ antiporter NhaD/arsenite permease-like protein
MHTYTGVKSVIHVFEHAVLIEYIPFIVLLFSLYVISGGISLRVTCRRTRRTNTAFLGVGGLLASFIGTTGASMLLDSPAAPDQLGTQAHRHTVIFFIFLVSNCGGCCCRLVIRRCSWAICAASILLDVLGCSNGGCVGALILAMYFGLGHPRL